MIAYCCWEEIVSDGSGDQGEGFASKVFSFGVSYIFSCRLQSCFQAEFVFMSNALFFFSSFFFFLFFKISIWSDGSGDKEEGFGSRVFSFGVSTYSLANSNRVSKAEFVFTSNAFFFSFLFFFFFKDKHPVLFLSEKSF